MKKVVGAILSLVGNLGVLVLFAVSLMTLGTSLQVQEFDMTSAIALSVATFVAFIVANMGNKMEDGAEGSLKFKYGLMAFARFFVKIICLVASVAGVFILLAGLCAGFSEEVLNIIKSVIEEPNVTAVTFLGGYMFIGGAICLTLYNSYVLKHCNHCGASLKGGDYAYEEVERTCASNGQRETVTSKIRFEFTCPDCGEDKVFYKKMRTDAEYVDNFARTVVGD